MTRNDLKLPLPEGWLVVCSVDTGTYMSACVSAFTPRPFTQFTLDEFPNYHYVGDGEIELIGMTISEWAAWAKAGMLRYQRQERDTIHAWADQNTQFKAELQHHGIHLMANSRKLSVRTEVTREYVHAADPLNGERDRCYFAPWLKILPYELEMAQFQDEGVSAQKGERIKDKDHTLDCFEHNCSRRPRGREVKKKKPEPWLVQHLRANRWPLVRQFDPHLGRN